MIRRVAVLLFVALIALPAMAQDETKDAAKEKKAKRAEVLAALDLPKKAKALRDKGVDKEEVKNAIRQARKKKMKPKETKELLEAAEESVDENGPVDNFGAFVQKKLDEGLRGKELAAAIKAEHKARGKGKGWRPKKEKSEKGEKKDKTGKGKKEEKEKGHKPEKDDEGEHEDGADDDESGDEHDDESGDESGKGKGKGHGKSGKGGGK